MMPETATPASTSARAGGNSFMSRRVGPLPMWGWGLIGVGTLGLVLIMRRRGGVKAGAGGQPYITTDMGTPGGGGGGGGGAPAPPINPPGPGGGTVTAPVGTVTSPNLPLGGRAPIGKDEVPGAPGTGGSATGPIVTGHAPPGASSIWTRGTLTAAANSLQSTIDLANEQISRAGGGVVSITTGFNATNEQLSQELTNRGYTSTVWGGQVYAARNSQDFYNGLPPAARNALNKWLQGLINNGTIPGRKTGPPGTS